MINVKIYENQNHKIVGFQCKGHAGYANAGSDIVCAAVSVLVINTINSIEQFLDESVLYEANEKTGCIEYRIHGIPGEKTELLLNSLVLGLREIEKNYSKKYLQIRIKEV